MGVARPNSTDVPFAEHSRFACNVLYCRDILQELFARRDVVAEPVGCSGEFLLNEALGRPVDKFKFAFGVLKDIEVYRADNLETQSFDDVCYHLGLDEQRRLAAVPPPLACWLLRKPSYCCARYHF